MVHCRDLYHILFIIPQPTDIWVASAFVAIVTSAAMNICGKVFGYLFSILLGVCLGVEWLDHIVFLCSLVGTRPFPTAPAPLHTQLSSV